MIFRRLLGCAYLGFSLFILLSLFFGQGGLINFKDSLDYRARLATNIEDLKEINETLTLELKAVSSSPDTIKVYAREYGFFEKDEEIIKIQNAPEMKKFLRLGSLLRRNERPREPNPLFHVIGLAAALIAFLFSLPFLSKRSHAHL